MADLAPSAETGGSYEHAMFHADAALLRELGDRLVGQPHIALAEMIKNAYDADATLCVVELQPNQIVVTDNGHGMSKEAFLNYWMTIGTTNKQERARSPRYGRPVTGSKGVGRLSAQFLAHRLELVTTSMEDTSTLLRAKVNWDKAISAGELTNAEALYRVEPNADEFAGGSRFGTRVTMIQLKQKWSPAEITSLAQELWMLQPPMAAQFSRVANQTTDPSTFRVEFRSSNQKLADDFQRRMNAAINNADAIISGTLRRRSEASEVTVEVTFSNGDKFSESYSVAPLVGAARWQIRVFKLQGRQHEGIKVADARRYFERFGGVHVYDAGFRLPYYGVQQDWLSIEYDHSHRRDRSALLPERLQVRKALNDLPTQGRLFGAVAIDTGAEAREAPQAAAESGEFLKIQVTRDRLVSNQAYSVLRDAVRWSVDYYATRERLREDRKTRVSLPTEPAENKVSRVREAVEKLAEEQPRNQAILELADEIRGLSGAIETEREAEDSAKLLLGPLASAGMAALALEHEAQKQLRMIRTHLRKLRVLAKSTGSPDILTAVGEIETWVTRLEDTRRMFSPLLNEEDRDRIEALQAKGVAQQVVDAVAPLILGVKIDIAVPSDIYLPAATFAEWSALLQNVLLNAANATLDNEDGRRILIAGGRNARSAWLTVSDNGGGIDLAQAESFFEPFERQGNVSEDRQRLGLGGMGLGLTIVRMIAGQRRAKAEFVQPESPWATTFRLLWSSHA